MAFISYAWPYWDKWQDSCSTFHFDVIEIDSDLSVTLESSERIQNNLSILLYIRLYVVMLKASAQ